ncbi:MAG: acyl--CoA ligase [Candidatus Marinimicrobia bacterium]|nr:acyl--CoA ligase [Candidatus Neomarinimicrobiota bacterium]
MISTSDLQDRIYQAQCCGSVEPIEYMIPYPNLGTLIEGQNIKLAKRIWYGPQEITYANLLQRIDRTANWLESKNISNNDRILLVNCPSPEAEILAFGIWSVGAVLVLVGDDDIDGAITATKPKLIIGNNPNPAATIEFTAPGFITAACRELSDKYQVKHKALLSDEALVYWFNGKGVRLSHYNLLINTNGVHLTIISNDTKSLTVNLPANSTIWAVLQLLLPIYAGIELNHTAGDIYIGRMDQFDKPDFLVTNNPNNTDKDNPPRILIVPENTAVAQVGGTPVLMTEIKRVNDDRLLIKGHSVMMGYLGDALNELVFTTEGLLINNSGQGNDN